MPKSIDSMLNKYGTKYWWKFSFDLSCWLKNQDDFKEHSIQRSYNRVIKTNLQQAVFCTGFYLNFMLY